eukprot:GEMP01112263.1.p1 GENE.GEMP01112263.1~~GEMP01112263.1.p1  ORF type:complete len:141 (-),score=11.60 GEMP01112263.1:121-543(-)
MNHVCRCVYIQNMIRTHQTKNGKLTRWRGNTNKYSSTLNKKNPGKQQYKIEACECAYSNIPPTGEWGGRHASLRDLSKGREKKQEEKEKRTEKRLNIRKRYQHIVDILRRTTQSIDGEKNTIFLYYTTTPYMCIYDGHFH